MVLIVLRHGESEWNKENKFTGWTDVGLSETGFSEAKIAGLLLEDYKFNYVVTSHLQRTLQTMLTVTKYNKYNTQLVKKYISTESMNERNYGNLTGKNKTEIKNLYGEEKLHLWRRSYYEAPPEGESLHDVVKRVGSFYDNEIKHLVEEGHNVLIVAHGNSLRALFVHLNLFDEKTIETFEIPTAIPMEIAVDGEKVKYRYINRYKLIGSQIIDSRGFPTIEVNCLDTIEKKFIGKGSSPSGASCGSTEAIELRDKNPSLYHGKSVFKAIENLEIINNMIPLNDKTITDLKYIDTQLCNLDGTEFKSVLGGNTTTAVSFCIADACARKNEMELFQQIAEIYGDKSQIDFSRLPTPLVNIINGGKHGITGDLKIQEFMIFPNEEYSLDKKMQIICEVYHTLKKLLANKYGENATGIGDEGGFCPPITNTYEALNVIQDAIVQSNYTPNKDVFMAMDCAASEFYDKYTQKYEVEKNLFLTGKELVKYYCDLIEFFPGLRSIEDPFDESDYESWSEFMEICEFMELCDSKIMIVGDDLFTTNKRLIKKGLENKWANTLLLKVNQIGTITEAIEGAKLMFEKNKNVIVSHRSGETNHAYIVDIAVGIGAKYLKIGSPCRGERVEKFNRLVEIQNIVKYIF